MRKNTLNRAIVSCNQELRVEGRNGDLWTVTDQI